MKEGWEYKKLGDACIVERGSSPRPIKDFITDSDDGVNWIKIGDTNKNDKYVTSTKQKITKKGAEKSRFVEVGDFILSNSMSFGRPYIMKVSGYIHDGWFVLRLPEDINSNYFWYLLSSPLLIEQFNLLAAGAIVKNISGDLVKKAKLPIPPISEQKQIVAILDKAFAAIDQAKANIEKNIENVKELFQSKLNEIFSQKGDGWEKKSFQELSSRIGDGLHGTPNYDEKGKYFFINGNNLNDGKIEIKAKTKRVNKEEACKHKRELTDNTVLVSINGTLGNVAFYNNEPVILGKSACYINFNKEVNKYYIKYLVKSSLFFKNMAKQSTGATIKNFSLKSMRNYKLFLPPINVQNILVEDLKLIENNIIQIESYLLKRLANLEELKKSILQKAFAGELT